MLGHADKWDLCQSISEYLALSKSIEEPEQAKRLKMEAIYLQSQGRYAEAGQTMENAVKEMRRAAG